VEALPEQQFSLFIFHFNAIFTCIYKIIIEKGSLLILKRAEKGKRLRTRFRKKYKKWISKKTKRQGFGPKPELRSDEHMQRTKSRGSDISRQS
jgi:hypothetical protein